MAVYVVTWNLNKEKTNYQQARQELMKIIASYDNIADSGLESVRFVSTSQTADQVYNNIRKSLDDNDRLFVSKLNKGEHQGWLDKSTWDWINQRL